MARDPETIQREIERHRNALAESLDALSDRANPRRLVDEGRQGLLDRLDDPRVRYALIGAGSLVALVILRRLFR